MRLARFLKGYDSQLRPFETEYEVAPRVLVHRTGGHTLGHSVVRLASRADRMTFADDAVFQVGFEHQTGTTASNTTPRRRPHGGGMASHYTKEANRVRLAREARHKLAKLSVAITRHAHFKPRSGATSLATASAHRVAANGPRSPLPTSWLALDKTRLCK